jgi:hypothetical protein
VTSPERWIHAHPYTSALMLAVVSVPVLWAVGTYVGYKPTPLAEAWMCGCGIIIGASWVAGRTK